MDRSRASIKRWRLIAIYTQFVPLHFINSRLGDRFPPFSRRPRRFQQRYPSIRSHSRWNREPIVFFFLFFLFFANLRDRCSNDLTSSVYKRKLSISKIISRLVKNFARLIEDLASCSRKEDKATSCNYFPYIYRWGKRVR